MFLNFQALLPSCSTETNFASGADPEEQDTPLTFFLYALRRTRRYIAEVRRLGLSQICLGKDLALVSEVSVACHAVQGHRRIGWLKQGRKPLKPYMLVVA